MLIHSSLWPSGLQTGFRPGGAGWSAYLLGRIAATGRSHRSCYPSLLTITSMRTITPSNVAQRWHLPLGARTQSMLCTGAPATARKLRAGVIAAAATAEQAVDTSYSSLDDSSPMTVATSAALREIGVREVTNDQLFDDHHIHEWTPRLLLYFPLGALIASVRVLAWIAGVCAPDQCANHPPVQLPATPCAHGLRCQHST